MHRVLIDPDAIKEDTNILIEGDEAQHAARVKRLGVGDPLECLDGMGTRVAGRIAAIERVAKGQWRLVVEPGRIEREPLPSPELHVRTATPKGPRASDLVEQLCQVGASSWGPLDSVRTVVDPREGKLQRLERIARESIKQSGRAHAMRIEPGVSFRKSLELKGLIVADASGAAYEPTSEPTDRLTLLVGPEGGWTANELAQLREVGARVCRFGLHVMRIETAAVVAAGIILDSHARGSGYSCP